MGSWRVGVRPANMTDFPGDSIKEINSLHPQAVIIMAHLRAVEVSDIGKKP
jgi:hypothetical protein